MFRDSEIHGRKDGPKILNGLLAAGFTLTAVEEVVPPEDMMDIPGMKDEMRRPMMLPVRAEKR